MGYGYTGKILRIDLSTKEVKIDNLNDAFYRKYYGGACMGAYFLLKELKAGIDPFSPENIIIFSTSPLTGINCSGTAMHNIITKSPLTNLAAESTTPGYLGSMIKKAGYDALIISGKAANPAYLLIGNNSVKIEEAHEIWGKTTSVSYNYLIKKHGKEGSIALIGPAGENLVRYASIVNDNLFLSSRCGVGAVMGSKNLKAICVNGSNNIEVYDKDNISKISSYFKDNFLSNPLNNAQHGPAGNAGYLKLISDQGMLSAKNFHYSYFEDSEKIGGFTLANKYKPENFNCDNCFGGCKKVLNGFKKNRLDTGFGLIELESLASSVYNLLINNDEAALKIWDLICDYGLDGTSLGVTLGFAIECFENGLISEKDTGGITLNWGEHDSIIELIYSIIHRKNIGDILADGVRLASEKIRGSEDFAMHVKGLEIPSHDPRTKQMLGLGYAVSPIGPYYTVVEHDTDFDFEANQLFMDKVAPLTVYDRIPAENLSNHKVRMFYLLQPAFSMLDALCGCIFAFSPVRFFNFSHLVEMINSTTGWESSLFELWKLGEKRINMYKLFAAREGITSDDDVLPERFFMPIENGPKKGVSINKKEFIEARDLYYKMAGFDEKGIPSYSKLLELDLLEFIE
ncbi:MAG: aldehyde ferredoxin oxidoreductase family protein [Candidatus Humimicrobiaceae bacterium]